MQQIDKKGRQINLHEGGRRIHWELCKRLEMDIMVYAQTKIFPRKLIHKILWDFEIETDHLITMRWLDLLSIDKKKRTYL